MPIYGKMDFITQVYSELSALASSKYNKAAKEERFRSIMARNAFYVSMLTGKWDDMVALRKPSVKAFNKITISEDGLADMRFSQLQFTETRQYDLSKIPPIQPQLKSCLQELLRRELRFGISPTRISAIIHSRAGTDEVGIGNFVHPAKPKDLFKYSKSTFMNIFPAAIEYKYDGIRIQVHYTGRSESPSVVAFSRAKSDLFSTKLNNPGIPDIIASHVHRLFGNVNVILDAEAIVLLPNGEISDIGVSEVPRATSENIGIVVFDIMAVTDDRGVLRDLRDETWRERRNRLDAIFSSHDVDSRVRISHTVSEDFTPSSDNITDCKAELGELAVTEHRLHPEIEGIVLKPIESKYVKNSQSYWTKVKVRYDSEFMVNRFLHGTAASTKDVYARIELVAIVNDVETVVGTAKINPALIIDVDVNTPSDYYAKVSYQCISKIRNVPALRDPVVLDIQLISTIEDRAITTITI